MKPAQALDRHGQLLEILESSEPARDLVDVVAYNSLSIHGYGRGERVLDRGRDPNRPSVVPTLINHLRVAEVFHVAEHMMPLIQRRADELRGTSTFGEYPPPTPCGLVVFEDPVRWIEAGGRTELVHMFTWGPAKFLQAEHDNRPVHGTIIHLWNDVHREVDGVSEWLLRDNEESWQQTLRWTHGLMPTVIIAETADMRIGPQMVPVSEARAEELREDGLVPIGETASPTRMVCATWQLLDETITVVKEDAHIERHFRKRAVRRGLRPRVTVITLRRTTEKGLEGSRGPLEERHRVRGHWRTYWVGTGDERHRERRWIDRHISPKNPELPMAAETQKVSTLKR